MVNLKKINVGRKVTDLTPSSTPFLILDDRGGDAINPFSGWSLGPNIATTINGVAWPAANKAIFVPFRVPFGVIAYKMACATSTGTTGNFDLGIYDKDGVRLVSTGTQAKTTATSERIIDITDTYLKPDLYYMAMVTDGTTAYNAVIALSSNAAVCNLMGMREMSTAFTLPTNATYASCTSGYIPIMGIYLRGD